MDSPINQICPPARRCSRFLLLFFGGLGGGCVLFAGEGSAVVAGAEAIEAEDEGKAMMARFENIPQNIPYLQQCDALGYCPEVAPRKLLLPEYWGIGRNGSPLSLPEGWRLGPGGSVSLAVQGRINHCIAYAKAAVSAFSHVSPAEASDRQGWEELSFDKGSARPPSPKRRKVTVAQAASNGGDLVDSLEE